MNTPFDLTGYMNKAVSKLIQDAFKAACKNPREAAFIIQYMLAERKKSAIRKGFEKIGEHIPPFLIASITSSCNMFCKGCYARAVKSCGEEFSRNQLSHERWGEIFQEAEKLGISFILLAGGEPLLRREVIEKAAGIKNIIFPIFTNGTLIDDNYIKLFDKDRNLVPILSLEGEKEETDNRRGGGTYDLLINVMERLKSKGIFFGVSTTVTTENVHKVSGAGFVNKLHMAGCKLLFFVEYVPVDGQSGHLALTDHERGLLESNQETLKLTFGDMLFLSFPGDEKETGGCLAAGRGFFHISPNGSAEPCPFSPFSDTNLQNCSLKEALQSPLFVNLNQTGLLLGEHTGGCVLYEKEKEVRKILENGLPK